MRILGQIIEIIIFLLHLCLGFEFMMRLSFPLILINIQDLLIFLTGTRVTIPFPFLILHLFFCVISNMVVWLHINLLHLCHHFFLARQGRLRVPCSFWYGDLEGVLLIGIGLRFYLLEDVIELLIGGLVIGMIRPMFLQEVLADLQLFLDVCGDWVR